MYQLYAVKSSSDSEARFACPYCGETNEVLIDPSGGEEQKMIEDCHVCCRPIIVTMTYDPHSGSHTVNAKRENE